MLIFFFFIVRNENKRESKRPLPYCKDSLALAHKNINQRRIRLHRFRFLHNDKCELILFNASNGKRRSLSQPNINRNWVCLSCEWLNCTVAWHCISCDYPSILAPIYKATINKKQSQQQQQQHDNNSKNCGVILESEENENNTKKEQTEVPEISDKKSLLKQNSNNKNQIKRWLSMESGLNHKCTNKKRCQLCFINRYDLFSENQGINNNHKSRLCHHSSIKFPEFIKLPFVIDDLSKIDFNNKNLNNYLNKRINKSLSSISGEPLNTSYSSDYLKDSSPTDLRRSLRLTKINNTSFETSSQYKRQLSEPNTQTEINNRIYQNVTCDICGICNSGKNRHFENKSGHIQETSRFTITTLKRQKGNQLGDLNSKHGTHDRAGVFVAVKDWTITPVCSSSISPHKDSKTKMNDNSRVYENSQIIKQHTTNNNSSSAYENISLAGSKSDTNDNSLHTSDNCSNDKGSDPPLYAVVNKTKAKIGAKGISDKEKQTVYSYIGISDPKDQKIPPCDSNMVEDDGIYATISANSANNNINGSSIANFTDSGVKSNQITSTSCTLNSNDANGVSETGDIYAKVWKGPKKSMDTQKR